MTWGNMGTLTVRPDDRERLIEILTRPKPELAECGCLVYEVGRNEDYPDRVYVLEVWVSAEAHRDSLGRPGVLAAMREALPLLSGDMISLKFDTAGSPLNV